MKKKSSKPPEFLSWEEIRPIVELTGFVSYPGRSYTYRNPAHHLLLVNSGRIDFNTSEGSFSAQTGDLVCLRPAERNHYGHDGPCTFFQAVIEFAPPPRHLLTPMWDDVGPLPVKVSMGDSMPAMRRLFETLCVDLPHAGSAHQMRVRAAVFGMLAIITDIARTGAVKPIPENPWHRTRLMLESQLVEELRVDQLARQMGMSVNHFIRQFRRHFGVTPKAYHTLVRLREGARLLRDPERSVKSIAYLLGFSDTKTFARRFRHHFGVNPSDLRDDAPALPDTPPSNHNLLYPVNQHVLPPTAGTDYLDRYVAKKG